MCWVLSVVHFIPSVGRLMVFVLCVFSYMQFNMDRVNVEEFYEVYKGVVSEYNVSMEVTVTC